MTLITKRKRGKPEQSQIVTFLKLVLKLIQSISSLALVTHPIVCTLRQLATFKPFCHQFCSTSYRAGNVQVKCVVSSSNQPLRSLPINAGVHDDLFLCGKVQFRNRARSHLPSPLHHIWSKTVVLSTGRYEELVKYGQLSLFWFVNSDTTFWRPIFFCYLNTNFESKGSDKALSK